MKTPDMSGPELLAHCGYDAPKWAQAFCEHVELHKPELDEGYMIGWFANAIMNTIDLREGSSVTVLPDGSACFVGTTGGD